MGMSDLLRQYLKFERDAEELPSGKADEIWTKMDRIWWLLTDEERKFLNNRQNP